MNSKLDTRKSEIRKYKTNYTVVLIILLSLLMYIDYDFNSYIFNGIVSIVTSFIISQILFNNAFYIETGMEMSASKARDKVLEYSEIHPFWTLYNKIISLAFFFIAFLSIVSIIIGLIGLI